jgi:orotidine-5'-phosphate decarboxylase
MTPAPGSAMPSASATTPILALDVPSLGEAQALVRALGDDATFYKVGLQLFTAEGPRVVEWLHEEGKSVFLDLKLHDIPNTVQQAARSAASLGVKLLTVHGVGGSPMVRAAVEGAGSGTGILVVTVLTSMDLAMIRGALGYEVPTVAGEVARLATVAADAGAHGVVCSGHECAAVVGAHPQLGVLVPGIRAAGGATHDQSRVVTPEQARAAGARYVVIGRAVTAASDPVAALRALRSTLDG